MKKLLGVLSLVLPYLLLTPLVDSGDVSLAFPWIALIGAILNRSAQNNQMQQQQQQQKIAAKNIPVVNQAASGSPVKITSGMNPTPISTQQSTVPDIVNVLFGPNRLAPTPAESNRGQSNIGGMDNDIFGALMKLFSSAGQGIGGIGRSI